MAPHTTSLRLAATAAGAALLLGGCALTGAGPARTLDADATVPEAVTAVELTGVRSGDVEVAPGSGPGVTVRRVVHYRGSAEPRPGQRVSGGVLTFSDGCGDDCWIDYRLEVPAAVRVKVESSSGDITVRGVARAELTAASGDVRAEGITGPLKVRTASGRITATGLEGADAEFRAASGDVDAGFAKAPASVSVTSSSGDVTLRAPRAPYRVSVDTASGDRENALGDTPAAPSRIAVRTTSGDVRLRAL
ncbi:MULTISPECIES: DUF4097 family beta strand repeat-containing protein [Streptomyces]|uniref:DUF4097 family beta strand repeat-containing protein n=1 Tax=Streptomyces TaxID=1883 RepID=UPI000F6D56E5|nr:DUF4097 family beta strand repeat-containing protein [Streptomyces sp. W1SF4]AZM91148.1 hypothetical protein D1J60_23990 [Streptomyces sp. W1SF4]